MYLVFIFKSMQCPIYEKAFKIEKWREESFKVLLIFYVLGFLSRAFNLYLQRFFFANSFLRTTDHKRTLLIFRKI